VKRYAAIDLGTNTFHMIIVEVDDSRVFTVVYRKRYFVKLAQDGFQVIKEFKKALIDFEVSEYKAYGTAMFRVAKNAEAFVKELEEISGINIEIIDGNKEAELIFYGAKMSKALDKGVNLIVDIGGGSVEFIVSSSDTILADFSIPIGILELFHRFSDLEPFNLYSINEVYSFIDNKASEFKKALKAYKVNNVVGTAGSFEVLRKSSIESESDILFEITKNDFDEFYNSIVFSSYEDRLKLKGIPDERKRLIVYALVLINYSLIQSKSEKITVTSYSMKEGMIWELINEK